MKDANIVTPEPPSDERQPEISPAIQSQKDNATTLKDVLDISSKLIFGLAGLCYVLGVVVVTIHLRQYGVTSLDLPQLRYVTAGVWVVMPIGLITTFIMFGIFLAAAQTEELQRGRSWAERIYLALSTLTVLMIIIIFFWGSIGIEFSWSVLWIPPIGIAATILILAGGYSLRRLRRTTPLKDAFPFVGALSLGLILFAVYVILFARYTYQSIPWATGGGRSSVVRLFITPESIPYVQGLKITQVTSQQNGVVETDRINLLLTTEKQFVVINADGKAVSLPADLVKGIAYEK